MSGNPVVAAQALDTLGKDIGNVATEQYHAAEHDVNEVGNTIEHGAKSAWDSTFGKL